MHPPVISNTEAWERLHDRIRALLPTSPLRKERIFISYAWPQAGAGRVALQRWLSILQTDLQRAGFHVFLDLTDMPDDMKEGMTANIEASDAVLVIVTPLFTSRAANAETNVAYELRCILKAVAERRLMVMPLVLESTDDLAAALPDELRGFLARDMRDAAHYVAWLTALQPLGIIPALLGRRKGDEEYQACMEEYRQKALLVLLPPRNPLFCGREGTLVKLAAALEGSNSQTFTGTGGLMITGASGAGAHQQVVAGLGGIGKTQLVLEFVHRTHTRYKMVRWLAAEGGLLRQSMEQLAEDVGLQPEGLSEREMADMVYAALTKYEPWLLVLDNVDGPEALRDLLPMQERSRAGQYFVVTSRSQKWPMHQRLSIDVFSEAEALEFLRQRLSGCESNEREEAARRQLAEKLGYLPLALGQAAAYMDQTGRGTSGYLQLVERALGVALGMTAEGYPHSLAATLTVSMEQLQKTAPRAWGLLRLCAYLGPDDIPRWFLEELLKRGERAQCTAGQSGEDVDENVCSLRHYSLVQWGCTAEHVSVHRLVQQVLRLFDGRPEAEEASDEHLHAISAAISDVHVWEMRTDEEIQRMRELLVHMEAVAGHLWDLRATRTGASLNACERDYAEVAQKLATTLGEMGNAHRQKELLERVLAIEERQLGPDTSAVAKCLTSLALACGALGDTRRMKELLERALAINEKLYGPDNVEVARTLGNLANAQGNLGEPGQKKALLERALTIFEKYLDSDHLEIAITLANLANVHGTLGDSPRKKELLERALVIEEKHYGADHYEVARTMTNLANAHGALKDPQRMKELLVRALAVQEKYYGPDHVEVARILGNLANAYGDLGDEAKRVELLERTLAIKEKHFGSQHYEVAHTLTNLAIAHATKNPLQMKALLERALAIQETYYGANHYEVARTLVDLAKAHGLLKERSQQKEALKRALRIQEGHFGPEHLEVVSTVKKLALVYGEIGDTERMKNLLKFALSVEEKGYDRGHFKVAATMFDLARTYAALGNFEKAVMLLVHVVTSFEKHYGPTDAHTMRAKDKLCRVKKDMERKEMERKEIERKEMERVAKRVQHL